MKLILGNTMSFSGKILTSDPFQNLFYPPCFPVEKGGSVESFDFNHPRIVEYYDRYGANFNPVWEKVLLVGRAFFILCVVHPAACLGVVYNGVINFHAEALKQDLLMSLPAITGIALYQLGFTTALITLIAIDLLHSAYSLSPPRLSTFLARVVPSGTEFHWMFSMIFRRTLGLELAVPEKRGDLGELYQNAACHIERRLISEVVAVF